MFNTSIILNRFKDRISSHHLAIAASERQVNMVILNDEAAGMSYMDSGGAYSVHAQRLDSIIKEDIHLLKIDVEVRTHFC